MPNPLAPLTDKFNKLMGAPFVLRLKQQAFGLVEDFWKDGPENLFKLDLGLKLPGGLAHHMRKEPIDLAAHPSHPQVSRGPLAPWHAEAGEISEKMWGEGFVTPGGNTINTMLIKPLGLTKDMNVLDLSAGLGGGMRRTMEETGATITALEPDAAIAVRGMQLSVKAGKGKTAPIAHYDPAKLMLNRAYDCVIARETFYRLPDRASFLAVITKHTRAQAQIAYTDYIVDLEHRDNSALRTWKNFEKHANPLGLVESAEFWAKAGFSLRVHEDLTDFYKAEVMVGMKRLMEFLASGTRPDPETSIAVLRRIETWKHRLAAMNAGMKFYRFYGTKH